MSWLILRVGNDSVPSILSLDFLISNPEVSDPEVGAICVTKYSQKGLKVDAKLKIEKKQNSKAMKKQKEKIRKLTVVKTPTYWSRANK